MTTSQVLAAPCHSGPHHPHAFLIVPFYGFGEPVVVSCPGVIPRGTEDVS